MYVTARRPWFDDPLAVIGAASLSQPGTIYVVASSLQTKGLAIDADNVGLVTLRDATIGYLPDPSSTGPTHVIAAKNKQELWVEVTVDGHNEADRALELQTLRRSRLHRLRISNTTTYGVSVDDADGLVISDLEQHTSGSAGLYITGGRCYRLTHARLGNNVKPDASATGDARGLLLNGADQIVIHDFVAVGNDTGVHINPNVGTVIGTRLVLFGNGGNGLRTKSDTADRVFSHVTAVANSEQGIGTSTDIKHLGPQVWAQILAVDNDAGVSAEESGPMVLSQVVATNNEGHAIEARGPDCQFHGQLVVGPGSSTQPLCGGLLDATCEPVGGLSDASVWRGVGLGTTTFQPGSYLAHGDLLWSNSSDFILAGRGGAELPARGRCGSEATPCVWWDLRIASGSPVWDVPTTPSNPSLSKLARVALPAFRARHS